MGNQRSGRALLCLGIALLAPLATGLAQAATPAAPWTEAKAAKIVKRDATVRFSPSERAALESELHALVREYIQLENAAAVARLRVPPVAAPQPPLSLLDRVEGGARGPADRERPLRGSRCAPCVAGSRASRARSRPRSSRFPVAEVTWEDGAIASVVEREPRVVGPLAARLSVRITARSAIAFSQR